MVSGAVDRGSIPLGPTITFRKNHQIRNLLDLFGKFHYSGSIVKGNLRITKSKGLTLIEMTLVILLMIALSAAGFTGARAYNDWTRGREAGEVLREVYAAQKLYLADHPTEVPANLTTAGLLPYLRNRTTFPTVTDLQGNSLAITVTDMPPTIAGNYDPSGNPTDNIWDVGE